MLVKIDMGDDKNICYYINERKLDTTYYRRENTYAIFDWGQEEGDGWRNV